MSLIVQVKNIRCSTRFA